MCNKERGRRKPLWRFLFGAMAAYGGIQLIRMLWMELLLLTVGSQTLVTKSEVYSVGIIGGADGPTSILVAAPGWSVWILPCVLLTVGILGFWRLSRCKQK